MARAMSMATAFVMAFTVVQAASAEVLSGMESLDKKDVNMGSLKDPHAMLTEIEDIVQSGETPAFDLLSNIKGLIVDEMLPGLTTIGDLTSQDTLDLSDAIQMCNNESKAKEVAIKGAIEEDVDDKRSLHAACRDGEITMYNHNLTDDDSYCIKLGKFLHDAAGQNLHIPDGANRDASVLYVETASDTNMCGRSEVRALADSCAAKEGELSSKSDDCDEKQASFEVAFCTWKTQLESNCETLDSCHAASVAAYDKHVAKTQILVTKWDAETATLQKILCYLNTWLNEIDAADNRSQHNASHFNVCRDNQTYTPLPVNYGTRPAKIACLLTSVANFPGTSGFITQEYNNFLDFIHPVVPCPQATCDQPSTTGYNFGSAAGTTTIDGFAPTGVACAIGYAGTVAYTKCASAGSVYSVSGCKATCDQPSTMGYNFGSAAGTTTIDGFAPTGVACANGYAGTVTYTKCASAGSVYSVSGCKATCDQPSTTGYNFGSAAGTTTIDGFAPTGVACANGYTGTVTYTKCASAGSVYSVSGCKATSQAYVETPRGSSTCPSGREKVTDQATCRNAGVALGKSWQEVFTWSNIQPGCFSGGNNQIWFNTNGAGTTHGDFSSICGPLQASQAFVLAPDGSTTCPQGYAPIDDIETCKLGASVGGYTYHWAGYSARCGVEWPRSGCFSNGMGLYFSNCGAGRLLTTPYHHGICQAR